MYIYLLRLYNTTCYSQQFLFFIFSIQVPVTVSKIRGHRVVKCTFVLQLENLKCFNFIFRIYYWTELDNFYIITLRIT